MFDSVFLGLSDVLLVSCDLLKNDFKLQVNRAILN